MNKFSWPAVVVGLVVLIYLVFALMRSQTVEAPPQSDFIGPTGPPSVIGPTEPVPDSR
ncbi:MAG: hypothetical protein UX23_C0001G0099 [Parcubacteria group bacterium GW2011_GWB1_45_9]|nr:MAG: hypothetical protein UX23_C0001G0099 [Parcubacteria group bacterium GW2011_GWB1_45_9]